MVIHDTQYLSAAALFQAAGALHKVSRRMRIAARRLHAWLEKRRIAADARRDLGMMDERELKDIGLTAVDVERVARGASDRINHPAGAYFNA